MKNKYPNANYKVFLYGSLALTGKGHLTDYIILKTLGEEKTEIFLPTVITLTTGTYKVGKDIASGIYNLRVVSGCGLIHGDLQEGYLSEMMGIMEGYEEYYSKTYKNLYLKNGDEFEITSGVSIEFVPIS